MLFLQGAAQILELRLPKSSLTAGQNYGLAAELVAIYHRIRHMNCNIIISARFVSSQAYRSSTRLQSNVFCRGELSHDMDTGAFGRETYHDQFIQRRSLLQVALVYHTLHDLQNSSSSDAKISFNSKT